MFHMLWQKAPKSFSKLIFSCLLFTLSYHYCSKKKIILNFKQHSSNCMWHLDFYKKNIYIISSLTDSREIPTKLLLHRRPRWLIDVWRTPQCNVAFLAFWKSWSFYFGTGVVHSGCSDEAALRLPDTDEMREEAGLLRAEEEKPSIYRQWQNERKKKVKTELIRGSEVRRRVRCKNSRNW